MKIRYFFTVLCLFLVGLSTAQTTLPLPPQAATFTGLTRGYFFTAPVDFTITSIGVPTDASTGNQSVVIVTLDAAPPAFPGSTTAYTTEFLAQNVPGPDPIAVNVPITAGQVVGILGSRTANSVNSYGQPNPFNTTLLGQPVSLARFLMQGDLQSQWPFATSTEPGANNNNIGRVEITVAESGAPSGECGDPDPKCNLTDCVTITCPPDATVACIDDIVIDGDDATASSTCGAIVEQWVSNPCILDGAEGCPGVRYIYTYKALDAQGNIGCCERTITIDNTPAVVTVPPGETVNCFEEIEVSIDDAEVTNDCAEYNLYLTAPQVVGEFGCPGTQYIYTYRLIDECGRTVEATRTFTEGANAGPTIEAPADITCECLAGVNPNPDLAMITTSCGAEAEVTVSGPQQFGTLDCPGTIYRYFYTVTDACGRTSMDFQDFTVQNSSPTFSGCEEDTWLQFNCEDFGGEAGTIDAIEAYIASVEAYSACGDQLSVFNNFNSNNINTCINNGINTITFRATDNCGRTSFCTTTYVVVDTEAPDIVEDAQDHWEICNYNSPDNFDDWVDNNGGAVAFDGCSGTNVFWSTIPSNPSFNCMGASGTTSVTVTFVARDNCGNTSETTATFNAFMGGGDMVQQDQDPQANIGVGNAPTNEIPTDMEIQSSLNTAPAGEITLYQNRPNPFKAETNISFNLPEASKATLTIYDINGKVLKVIEANYNAGYNEVTVNRSELGATGVMFYRLMTDTASLTKSMVIMD